MYAEERQQRIVERAHRDGRVVVAQLAQEFTVTSETIRRDLDALAARGILSRVHGGAVPAEKLDLIEDSLRNREVTAVREKAAIARRAVQLLPAREGLSVLLDAGTTTARVAGLLPPTVSQVITNSVSVAAAVAGRSHVSVHMLGGTVRDLTLATVGAATCEEIHRSRVDVAFLGANGFSVDHAFSTPDPSEAQVKRAMAAAARDVHVVADSSKWGADYLVSFASLAQVHTLVTDGALGDAAAYALERAGLPVERAPW